MKIFASKEFYFVAFAFVTFSMASCDLLDKADDVDFDVVLEDDFEISEESEGTNKTYSQILTLDATSDPDINKYKNKISGFKINKITYIVSQYTGASNSTFSGTLSFGDASSAVATVAVTITNLNLQTAYTSGTEYELLVNQADIDKIGALLKDDKAVKLYLNGSLTATPAFADIKVFLDASVTADAL